MEKYKTVKDSLKTNILDLNNLRITNPELVEDLINEPLDTLPQFPSFKVTGHLGNELNPRTVKSCFLSKLIAIEGIVTSLSLVKPKLIKSVHYSESKKIFLEKEYRDSTMISKLPITNTSFPTKDASGPLSIEFGLSSFMDYQTATIQELIEKSPLGQLPRSIDVILTEDLVDRIKPGDRVRFIGVFKALGGLYQGFPSRFKTVLIVNNFEFIGFESEKNTKIEKINEVPPQKLGESGLESIVVEGFTFKNIFDTQSIILQISQREDILNLIANSIAPSIFGHENVKKAIAMQLVGGNEIVRKNMSRNRGDINILLIGDPGTAKSQLLRYVKSISPLCINTTGRGVTGVGLTAAVVLDKETGDKRLEAGAMVIADRGIVCIDEFDKMDDGDKVSLHEVMEQQTISISKAGISTTLNARCSVLAAANPIYGNYKENLSPSINIGLPQSLITRFDLIFIILDNTNDEKIADHILNKREDKKQDFLREYIAFAKTKKPNLTSEASNLLVDFFVKLRKETTFYTVTPRMLETLIRLATATAKLRLSETIDINDAQEAINLLNSTLRFKTQPNEEIKEEDITSKLYAYRDNNPDKSSVPLNVFLKEFESVDEQEVRKVLVYLHSVDVILFYDDVIFFL